MGLPGLAFSRFFVHLLHIGFKADLRTETGFIVVNYPLAVLLIISAVTTDTMITKMIPPDHQVSSAIADKVCNAF